MRRGHGYVGVSMLPKTPWWKRPKPLGWTAAAVFVVAALVTAVLTVSPSSSPSDTPAQHSLEQALEAVSAYYTRQVAGSFQGLDAKTFDHLAPRLQAVSASSGADGSRQVSLDVVNPTTVVMTSRDIGGTCWGILVSRRPLNNPYFASVPQTEAAGTFYFRAAASGSAPCAASTARLASEGTTDVSASGFSALSSS